MNKFKTLVSLSKYSWIVATLLMIITWFKIFSYAFSHLHYVIEDKFIHIGVLGGWLFIQIWFTAIIIFAGWYIIRLIGIIENDMKEVKDDE